uniref:Uncharacterized protein n=1 Tax=Candidatus Kentrum sp. SD TaxID=2126332 RepID=A0A450YDH9_9GAMM|nr:MAG: hypothetical protein BECKSD772F_GA0070984_100335 [Candidatus Kentron sp. SD]VFK39597.1 MAG: hypothetical protein BECKSD772E_GA0070983_100340 [Candidatus Kentron sp. SD]VFK78078.1 MAG: hypothetical protein BECKSD772D_GA0070982_100633 [Candidatus Kentron sp. SD]
MPYQNINATLSSAEIKAIIKKMPFLVNLTVKERRARNRWLDRGWPNVSRRQRRKYQGS